jgi:hypothetical protein
MSTCGQYVTHRKVDMYRLLDIGIAGTNRANVTAGPGVDPGFGRLTGDLGLQLAAFWISQVHLMHGE